VLELDDLQQLMDTQEELHDDLLPYLEEDGPLGHHQCLRHPLVYSVLHHPQLNALVNAQYAAKKEALREYKRRRQWHSYVFTYERPYRLEAFAWICHHMGDRSYWDLLGNVWTDTENIWQCREQWRECLSAERKYRSHMMSVDERAALAHDIDAKDGTIYRGFCKDGAERGMSWTTNSIVAKFFARRLAGAEDTPRVATGKVDRRDIIAYFEGRSEHEVVVLPGNVRDIEIREVAR
jgi:hypothetical protein